MTTLDTSKDPYGRSYYASKKRRQFDKLKQTPEFQAWRKRQFRIQQGKCAYCKIRLYKNNIVTHVDHIDPLYYEGTNDYDNLLLACRRCNTKKWVNDRYVKPDWIKKREAKLELKTARYHQRKQMQELVAQELDERIAHEIRGWA
jgi:5-methylcytosine-specific restriction endonuclease McrA